MENIISDSSGQFNFTSASNQREFLLAKLKEAPVTTLQARTWGIMAPAARIMDLRKMGHNIVTGKAKVSNSNCVRSVAEYVLLPPKETSEEQ